MQRSIQQRVGCHGEVQFRYVIDEAAKQLGCSSLRENQEKIVCYFLSGREVFVSMPTGSGKSLCYCLLPLVFDAVHGRAFIMIVVSLLVALMKDQV